MSIRFGAALAVLCVVAVSCGESDLEIPAAVEDFTDRAGETQYIYEELSQSERSCIFRREADEIDLDLIVTGLGADADAERTLAVQIGIDCVDDPTQWTSWVQLQADLFAEGLGQGVELEEEEGACVIRHVLENARNPARLFAVGDDPADVDVVIDAIDLCLSERNLALFYGDEVAFEGYGDDAALDALHDDCDAAAPVACDLLYWLSGVGSAYEAYGASCGETVEPSEVLQSERLCTGIELNSVGAAVADDARFLQLRDDCGTGDPTSCDLLFHLSDFGSDLEDFGYTCGERFPLGGNPDCRASMADS